MKLPFALVLLALAACRASLPAAKHDLLYTVELQDRPALGARFSLCVEAADDGSTPFAVDGSWGGVDDAGAAILDVHATAADGRSLPVERVSDHAWRVRSAPHEPLTVGWRIDANDLRRNPDPRVHYHALLDDELLHFIGHLALLVPGHLEGSAPRSVRFAWKGFREAGWTVASSFGVEPEGFVARASLDELRHAVYLAGRDVRVRRVAVRGREVAVAIAGRAWTFGDDEFVEDVRSIVEAERAFFADDDFPFYLVSAIPVGLADPHSRSLGGTGLTRSFALFLQPDTPLGTRAGGDLQVPHVLAHEMFHHWNGGIASMEEPEQLVYWFSEGFTEFFARRLLLRAGYGGRDEFARSLNATLRDHALSPVRDAPNERIRLEFWRDRDVGRLPYLRGDLVAVLLDREIRSRSGGVRSLDDFVREVVDRGRRGEKVGTDPLLRRIADWTDAAFAGRVRAIVVDGAPVPLDPSTFEPCLEMRSEEAAAFDLGFDLEASRSAKETRGVRTGSAAERAGLRDGLPLLRCSITFGQADVPVEVGVRDAGAERTIRWLPRGESSPVAKLVPREGASAQDCSRL